MLIYSQYKANETIVKLYTIQFLGIDSIDSSHFLLSNGFQQSFLFLDAV